jgi:hypothetical protein
LYLEAQAAAICSEVAVMFDSLRETKIADAEGGRVLTDEDE